MRALEVKPLAGTPAFVSGVSIIRGAPLPVVDTASLLGVNQPHPKYFVTIKAGDRRVVLAIDAVLKVAAVPAGSIHELPPLLDDAGSQMISAIGALDADLLLVLRNARLIPEAVWTALESGGPPQ